MLIDSPYNSKCRTCGHQVCIGDRVEYIKGIKGVRCFECSGTGSIPVPRELSPEQLEERKRRRFDD